MEAGAVPPSHNTHYKESPAVFAEILAQLPEPKKRQTIPRPSGSQQSRCHPADPLARLRGAAEVPADAICCPSHPELLAGACQAPARRSHQHPGSLAGTPQPAGVHSPQEQGRVPAGSLPGVSSTAKVMPLALGNEECVFWRCSQGEEGGWCESGHYSDLHRPVSPHSIHDPLLTCPCPLFAHAF